MPEPEPEPPKDDAGWAGVVKALLQALGGAAKYAVIVAGLLAALYFFIEQQSKIASEAAKARQEAEKLNEEKLRDADERLARAQTQLVDTYARFQEIGSKQVSNLKEVLEFREIVDKQNRQKIDEVQKLEAEKREAEQELSQHKSEGERLTAELAKKSDELNVQKIQIDKARLDFEQERREREDADRSRMKQLTERAETFNRIKDKLISLATNVENVHGQISDDTRKLAHDILEALQSLEQRLGEFFQNPNANTFNLIKSVMIGASNADLQKIDLETLGASLYLCNDKGDTCIVVTSQDEISYNGIIGISFDKDLVIDMEYVATILGIRVYDANDWNKKILASRLISTDLSETDLVDSAGDTWRIQDVAEKMLKSAISVSFDKNRQAVSTLSVAKYRSVFPDDYRNAVQNGNVRGEPAVNFAMETRAATFRASDIPKIGTLPPPDILERFNQVADAAVARKDPDTLASALDASVNAAFLGRFAAVLLKRDFQIVSYQSGAGDANVGSIIAEYHPLETGSDTRRAIIQFRRAADASWRLVGMDITAK